MTTTIKQWLQTQINTLKQVRTCVIDPPNNNLTFVKWHPDLIVKMWTGKLACIHIVDNAIQTSTVRDIMSLHTNNGHPALLIVELSLVPPAGHIARIPEWLHAVYHLTNRRIYAYTTYNDQPRLYELHLETAGRGEYKVAFGREVVFGNIRFNRLSLKERHVKGDWLTVSFSDGKFVGMQGKRADFDETARKWQPGKLVKTTTALIESYTLLEIEPGAKYETVKAAYRRLARQVHPDVSDLPQEEAEARFKSLNIAYAEIKNANGWT